jgi:peptidoglycan/LPS O-acetylase OafA/YrhL
MRRRNPYVVAVPVIALAEFAHAFDPPWVLNMVAAFFAGLLVASLPPSRTSRRAGAVAGALSIVLLAVALLRPSVAEAGLWQDGLFGGGFICGIRHLLASPSGAAARAIGSRALRHVGERSYTLYASHYPVALVVYDWAMRLDISRGWLVAWMLVVGVPCIALVTEVGYRLVERPALRRVRAVR